MARPDYQIVTIDLATGPKTKLPILGKGQAYNSVAVRAFPAGSTVSLSFYDNGPEVPLVAGDSFITTGLDSNGCPVAADEGLFVTFAVGAGLVVLLVSIGPIGGGVSVVAES